MMDVADSAWYTFYFLKFEAYKVCNEILRDEIFDGIHIIHLYLSPETLITRECKQFIQLNI